MIFNATVQSFADLGIQVYIDSPECDLKIITNVMSSKVNVKLETKLPIF